jgi:hypothetical protein
LCDELKFVTIQFWVRNEREGKLRGGTSAESKWSTRKEVQRRTQVGNCVK